ncbi:hypothetical protein Ahy_A07g033261 [Arachis hypogaea]|uniref:FAR1 domain-containing protein n=1 Tax=Arachis hypogaea TaxID=3818 RepID=A0A445C8N4_ARAHY|nr:hypothetical protein Ahy_A07g033261 [Arachis hypogaea]
MDANGGEAIGECGGGVSDVNEEMNAEEVGGDEVQEEHLPEGEPGFDLGADDILNQVWNSVEDAYEFYRRYGRVNGFGVRKGDSDKDSHGNVVRYRFFCNKEGLREIKHYNRIDRQRGHKAETRTGCKAMLSIYLEKSEQKWKVRKVNEFEEDWAAAIEEFGLQDSSWARHMHEKRKLWANAYLRDKFCAGFRTTSRCEGINAVVNKFSKSSHTILELVQNLELVVREYRNKEMLLQFNSIYTTPVMTTCLRSIEIAAASVYTREFFADVRKEIEGAGAVNLLTKKRCLNTTVYYLEEYEKPDVQVMAAFGRGTGKLNCQCFFWEKNGKDAKDTDQYGDKVDDPTQRGFLVRHGALHTKAQWLVYLGSQDENLFRKAIDGIVNLCNTLESACRGLGYERDTRGTKKVVRDPKVANPKGAPRLAKERQLGKRRRCANCKHWEPSHGNAGNYARNLDDLRRQFADSTSGSHVGNNVKAGCTFNDEWANEVRLPACVYVSSLKAFDDPSIYGHVVCK